MPGANEYPEWVRRTQETHDYVQSLGDRLAVRLHDDRPAPMAHTLARVRAADGDDLFLEADAEGWIEIDIGPVCPAFVDLEWGAANPVEAFPFRRRLIPECSHGTDENLVRAMLHNLGYDRDWPKEVAVKCFQATYAVDRDDHGDPIGFVEGQVPPDTRRRIQEIYQRTCDATPPRSSAPRRRPGTP